MEIALKNSEERFKKLSELTSEGVIIHKRGICIDVNDAVENVTGFKKEEIIYVRRKFFNFRNES